MVLTALLVALAADGGRELETAAQTLTASGARQKSTEGYIPELRPGSAKPGELVLGGYPGYMAAMWRLAAKEENLTATNVSCYGRQTIKYPRSWIAELRKLDHTKRRQYNFVGKDEDIHDARRWTVEFAKANFSADDIFEWTTIQPKNRPHAPFGPWDKTERNGDHWLQAVKTKDRSVAFDPVYFRTVSSSRFTLCPGGDQPYSLRYLDAVAAGSIPVVRSDEDGVDSPFSTMASVPYHHVALREGTPLDFHQEWADENYRLFIRYNTFLEGDNTPPGWTPPPGMEEMVERAERAAG